MNGYYYSTQTTLVDRIAKICFDEYYLYVAEEFNPLKNDPTSNPRNIRINWCRLLGNLAEQSEPGIAVWDDYKQWLKHIYKVDVQTGEKLDDKGEFILNFIVTAKDADAAPIVYVIPRNNIVPSRLHPGDDKGSRFPDNVEYVIKDLRDSDNFLKNRTECDTEPNF